mgnify:CR=1 FL=1
MALVAERRLGDGEVHEHARMGAGLGAVLFDELFDDGEPLVGEEGVLVAHGGLLVGAARRSREQFGTLRIGVGQYNIGWSWAKVGASPS